MVKKILLRFERGGEVTATLMEDKAPKTCKIVLSSLPVESKVLHAMWAGEEVFFNDFPVSEDVPIENETNDVNPGEILITSTVHQWKRNGKPIFPKGTAGFCIFYGVARPRVTVDETMTLNLFAKVDDVEKMREIGKRVRVHGTESIKVEAYHR